MGCVGMSTDRGALLSANSIIVQNRFLAPVLVLVLGPPFDAWPPFSESNRFDPQEMSGRLRVLAGTLIEKRSLVMFCCIALLPSPLLAVS